MVESNLDEQKVLVLFPSAKNYPKAQKITEGPAEKALSELENRKIERKAASVSAPRHINFESSKKASVRMSLDELIDVVDSQLELLNENNKRIKYYLDEIDFFWPESND